MSVELWESPFVDRGSVLTTELNALANNATCAAGPAYDNETNLDRYGRAELTVTYGTNPTLDSVVELYALCSLDGTNYEDGSSSLRPPWDAFCGTFQLYNNTSLQRLFTAPFELYPCNMKFIAINRAGQTMGASGHVVTLFTFNRAIV